jgi:hypothetical protein
MSIKKKSMSDEVYNRVVGYHRPTEIDNANIVGLVGARFY